MPLVAPTEVEDKSLLLKTHKLQKRPHAGNDASSVETSLHGTRRRHAIFQPREATNSLQSYDAYEPQQRQA